MPDLLEQSSAWLEAQRHKHLTRPVMYQRGQESVQISATVGKGVFELDDGTGAAPRVESRDYLILAADLVLGGHQTLPQRGDRIIETLAGQQVTFEVLGPGHEPAWRYSDPYRTTLRIHTKLVGA